MRVLCIGLICAGNAAAGWIGSVTASVDISYPGFSTHQACVDAPFCNTGAAAPNQANGYARGTASGSGNTGFVMAETGASPGYLFGQPLSESQVNAQAFATLQFTDTLVIFGHSGTFTLKEYKQCSYDWTGLAYAGAYCMGSTGYTESRGFSYTDGVPFTVFVSEMSEAAAGLSRAGASGGSDAHVFFQLSTPDRTDGMFSQSGFFGTQADLPEPSTFGLAVIALAIIIGMSHRLRRSRSRCGQTQELRADQSPE